MLPVNGARSELDWMGSSRSLMFAKNVMISLKSFQVMDMLYHRLDL